MGTVGERGLYGVEGATRGRVQDWGEWAPSRVWGGTEGPGSTAGNLTDNKARWEREGGDRV